jgi:glycosyltransferase involved in cell wall biosynthesis
MRAATVSCVIPVWNGEAYLAPAIESVLAQTHAPLEVIVVDDGSTDGTPGVIGAFGDRIVGLRQDNGGHGAARNAGLRAARGEYVAFLDADDLWHSDKLRRQLLAFDEEPSIGLCFTWLRNFAGAPPAWDLAPEGGAVPGYSSVTALVRRATFDAVGPFDASLRHGGDRDFFLRVAERGIAKRLLDEVLVLRRLHDANRSRRLSDNSRAEYLRILKASLDRRRRTGAVADLDFSREPPRARDDA